MPEMHRARRLRAQRLIPALGVDAVLVTSGVNVRYLTGLVSSNAAVLIPRDGPSVLCTDSRYAGTAERECPDVEIVIQRDTEAALTERALDSGLRAIAFEDREMTVQRHRALAGLDGEEVVGHGGAALELVPLDGAIDDLRIVKDEVELALLARACEITGEAFSAVMDRLRPGMTEREFAVALERVMVDLGADGPAFASIVASGPNGAIPHHVPSDRPFERGDLVTIDCGAKFGGYHADMTRTVAIGQPEAWQREIYDLVALAQEAGVAVAVVGADVADVDAVARDVIEGAGYGGNFTHGLGHGVGLEIHEAPWLGQDKTGTLADRVPITIEPGIYLAGAGGVRIEDTLVVHAGTGAAGSAQSLTTITRELLVL
ncbi:MAG TPA: aminopeptidase P family protein [Streptosporangiaceae bacterium]|nr:aminopeptidase P family protein [Streptosporangiaceae bacterium]